MNTKTLVTLFASSTVFFCQALTCQQGEPGQDPQPEAAAQEPSFADHLARFNPVTGTVKIGMWAEVDLTEGWSFLQSSDARRYLQAMGNPDDPDVLGVALPPDAEQSYMFAVFSYADDGHVEDEEPDYDELLVTMKEQTVEGSKARKRAGMQGVTLLGWAEPPHYDKAQHKLYWAKSLQFEGEEELTLNYNVRVLGRTGHLEINGVGSIDQLPLVAAHCKTLLDVTEFVEGQRYSDFDPAYDKVAAYGIGGLIAGKVALKTGLFAKLGLLLVKFLKPLLIGVALLGGLLWKVFAGRKARAAAEAAGSDGR